MTCKKLSVAAFFPKWHHKDLNNGSVSLSDCQYCQHQFKKVTSRKSTSIASQFLWHLRLSHTHCSIAWVRKWGCQKLIKATNDFICMWRKSADDRILGPTLNFSQLGGMEQSSGENPQFSFPLPSPSKMHFLWKWTLRKEKFQLQIDQWSI